MRKIIFIFFIVIVQFFNISISYGSVKSYNYPNPFNPLKQKTNIVYNVDKADWIDVEIFSEYGSLVYHTKVYAIQGINELEYDGRDDFGNVLYNGSYICRVKSSNGKAEACFIAIVK